MEIYGCQMNKAESSSLANTLTARGLEQTKDHKEADLVIINTCSVRKTAESRIWGRVGFYKRQKRDREITVVVMGCMSQRVGYELLNPKFAVDIVVGNFYKDKVADIIMNHRKGSREIFIEENADSNLFTTPAPDELNPSKAYVTISHGCNNFCTYCIVPYLRGREVSKHSDLIIEDIKALVRQGVKQVMLLGQNVNSYGNDTKDITFAQLLRRIVNETDISWVKFMSSHPKDLSDELIEVMATEPKVSKWIHLALQSGSDTILDSMNRRYTGESFKLKIDKLRARIPDVILTTDIIIGFPGETEEDFQDTMDLVEYVRFDDAFTYKYNERDNTVAQKSLGDTIADEVKVARLEKLIARQRKIAMENREAMKGRRLQILMERPANDGTDRYVGISSNELIILYDGNADDAGKVITVEITGRKASTLIGKRV